MEWISVEDKMPAHRQPVLMIAINEGPRGDYTTDQYAGWTEDGDWVRWPHKFYPSHWMPLPPPPST